jgi:hypothetical protein
MELSKQLLLNHLKLEGPRYLNSVEIDPCLLPDQQNIFYDCCTDGVQEVCSGISIAYFITLALVILVFGAALVLNRWIKKQHMAIYVFAF